MTSEFDHAIQFQASMPDWRPAVRAARASDLQLESAPPDSASSPPWSAGELSRLKAPVFLRNRVSDFEVLSDLKACTAQLSIDRRAAIPGTSVCRDSLASKSQTRVQGDRRNLEAIAAQLCNKIVTDTFPSSESYCQRPESLLKEMGRSFFSIEIPHRDARSSRRRLNCSRPSTS